MAETARFMTLSSKPTVLTEIRFGPGSHAQVTLKGTLDVESTGRCWHELEHALQGRKVSDLEVVADDLIIDGNVAVILLRSLADGVMTPGARVHFTGLREDQRRLLETFGPETLRDVQRKRRRRPRPFPAEVGLWTRGFLADWREQIAFVGTVLRVMPGVLASPRRLRWTEIRRVFETAGVNALPVVAMFSGLVGLVLALESARPLEQFGAQLFVADVIGFATIRDTGPLVTAIMLSARSSSAFAAELGTMKVNQELDALATMGLDPVRFLVVQRMIATLLLTPMLTLYAMLMGMLGGILVMRLNGFPPLMIYHQITGRVQTSDLLLGLVKSVLFGLIVGAVGCLRGLQTRQGPAAVGAATTSSVVSSIVLIIAADTVIAGVVYLLRL